MNKISRPMLQQLRTDLKDALAPLEKRYGLKFDLNGTIKFSYNDLTMKLTAVTCDPTDALSAERTAFERDVHAVSLYGLSKADYRREFTVDGRRALLVGVRPKAPKRPLIIAFADTPDKRYTIAPSMLGLSPRDVFSVKVVD